MKLHLTNFISVNNDEITEYSDVCDILPAVHELIVPDVPELIAVLVQVVLYNIVFNPRDMPVGLLLLRVRDILESIMLQIG